MPSVIRDAHRRSSHHRDVILSGTRCGCFYCRRTFLPDEIIEWCDDKQTAICPHCGIDSVLGDKSGFGLDESFLKTMRDHWFGV